MSVDPHAVYGISTGMLSGKVRLEYGISQQALADALGVHVMTVSRWERQNVDMEPIYAVVLDLLFTNKITLDQVKERMSFFKGIKE